MRLSFFIFVATALYVSAAPPLEGSKRQVMDFDSLLEIYGVITPSGAPLAATATATTVSFNAAAASASAASATVATVGDTQPTVVPTSTDAGEEDDSDEDSRRKRSTGIMKRDGTCAKQNSISVYSSPSSFSVKDFISNATYAALANGAGNVVADQTNTFAVATLPDGSQPWINRNGSANAPGYLGYSTLATYNATACQAACVKQAATTKSGNKCAAFNIYIERDPSLDPNASKCPNPDPITNVKCTLYSLPLSPTTATNTGQWRDSFQVVITASNAYNLVSTPPPIPGYDPPTALTAAINAPLDNGKNTYMGTASFHTADPNNCATQCDVLTAREKNYYRAGYPYRSCNFFNYYLLQVNGTVVQQVCSFYSAPWNATYAVNTGQTRGYDVYTIASSAIYTKSNAVITDSYTFEQNQEVSPYSFPSYNVDVTFQIDGFTVKSVSGKSVSTQIDVWHPFKGPYLLQGLATSNFLTCNLAKTACNYYANGFTFDLESLDLADLSLTPSTMTVSGYLKGAQVSTTSFANNGKFAAYDAFSGFTGLDQLVISSDGFVPALDNLAIIRYPSSSSTKRSDMAPLPRSPISARDGDSSSTYTVTLTNSTVITAPDDCDIVAVLDGTCGTSS